MATRSTTARFLPAAGWILGCEVAGMLGGLFTRSSLRDWYPSLDKPSFNPPSGVFAPVWTILYALMGLAASLVWHERDTHPDARAGLRLFGLQLGLNLAWSAAFFGLRSPLAGLADIAALLVAVVATIRRFARVSGPAALLLLPYLAWISFATVLNWTIWRLNSGNTG
ncbi:MAG: tryptophan-rich sensory protein [Sphaerobacter sp.]|nr:tryptophan-rich sensory protein [Sphaerobacter sp.]